ncbi:collagenase [Shewanella litorisediminis]|uniref:Collagenase n=1 Tax=Shewanella litorisediminis TaxID=1173586 RepID=A0ABX7G6I2_9GAMM|nr:collagenase [Shewanella litorisediminis]MCL2917697.1 collagenase [Shewanella litorisediminis]QRH02817.1 collagenase [Shewanella litorisediminis]
MRLLLLSLSLLSSMGSAQNLPSVDAILKITHQCSPTLIIRAQALTAEQIHEACMLMGDQEQRFHALLKTHGRPVRDDNNVAMRANIYADAEAYRTYVTAHFDVPSDNGGMYLEGHPERPGNQAEFVAYQKQGKIWNLRHEYVHYLDGRFNLYGDFCASLHDSHSAPEYCPKPAPLLPHLVWWSEGLAEYLAWGDNNPAAIELAAKGSYRLSEIFDTSYEQNGGSERVYRWGYLAVRFMLEHHKDKLEQMLSFTRKGDYPRYQALVREWHTSMDDEFSLWLKKMSKNLPVAGTNPKTPGLN